MAPYERDQNKIVIPMSAGIYRGFRLGYFDRRAKFAIGALIYRRDL